MDRHVTTSFVMGIIYARDSLNRLWWLVMPACHFQWRYDCGLLSHMIGFSETVLQHSFDQVKPLTWILYYIRCFLCCKSSLHSLTNWLHNAENPCSQLYFNCQYRVWEGNVLWRAVSTSWPNFMSQSTTGNALNYTKRASSLVYLRAELSNQRCRRWRGRENNKKKAKSEQPPPSPPLFRFPLFLCLPLYPGLRLLRRLMGFSWKSWLLNKPTYSRIRSSINSHRTLDTFQILLILTYSLLTGLGYPGFKRHLPLPSISLTNSLLQKVWLFSHNAGSH